MSLEVAIHVYATQTLTAGATAAFGHNSTPFNQFNYKKLSVSPDNFPASVEIIQEWSFTDTSNVIWLAARYANNGTDTVVFRPKALRSTPDLIVGSG